MPRVAWYSLPILLVVILIVSTLPSCSGGRAPEASLHSDATGTAATPAALAELDALPVPAGADPATFAMLKESFRAILVSGGLDDAAHQTSAGLGVTVDDLTYTDLGGGTVQLDWTYRHRGDYDQNSQVTVSDISPVGQYFNASSSSANWALARAADGDDNGLVNVSDLSPVGQNFGSTVTGYTIESSANPGDPATWTEVATVPFSQGVRPAGQTFRTFSTQLTGQSAGLGYRATAVVDSTGTGGDDDYDEVEDNDTYSTPNALPTGGVSGFTGSLGSGTGYSGCDGDLDDLFSFQVEAGRDVTITLAFNATTADLDLYLLNSSGDTLLSSIGTASPEQILAHFNVSGTFLIAAQAYDGYSDYTLDVTLTDPGFVEPPVETFTDYSQAGDTPARKWLLNCYRVLPAWNDADRCFQNYSLATWADEVLTLTNQQRSDNGLNPLQFDPHLELVAQAHARDMALQGYFAHDNLYGMAPNNRLDAVEHPGYTIGSSINGENIYAGRKTPIENSPTGAVDWWMNSPGHRANILNGDFTHLGIGVYYRSDDPNGYYAYFAQVFANWDVDPDSHDWLEPAEVPAP